MILFTLISVGIFCTACRVEAAPTFVYPKLFQSRSEDGAKVLTITKGLRLNLEKSSVFAPEFFIHSRRDGTPVRYHMMGSEMEKDLYHSVEQMASVDVSEEEGVKIEGIVGDTLRIKPITGIARSLDDSNAHLLYSTEQPMRNSPGQSDYGDQMSFASFLKERLETKYHPYQNQEA